MEAIRASFSSLNQFDAIKVGPSGQEETFVGAEQAFDNPIREAIKELRAVYDPKTRVNCVLSLGYGQPGVLTTAKIQDADSAQIKMVAAIHSNYLADEIEVQIGELGVYYRFSVDRGLEVPDNIPHDDLGLIVTHTNDYLQRNNIQGMMQTVITSLEQINSNVTIGDIGQSSDPCHILASHLPQAAFNQNSILQRILPRGCMGFHRFVRPS